MWLIYMLNDSILDCAWPNTVKYCQCIYVCFRIPSTHPSSNYKLIYNNEADFSDSDDDDVQKVSDRLELYVSC